MIAKPSRSVASATPPPRLAHGLARLSAPVLALSVAWPGLGWAHLAERSGPLQGPGQEQVLPQSPSLGQADGTSPLQSPAQSPAQSQGQSQGQSPGPALASPREAALVKPGRLSCGGTVFTAATHRAEAGGPVLAQQLWRQGAGEAQPQPLRHEGRPVKTAAPGPAPLDAWASGWACVQASSGQAYLYVLYTCPQDLRGCQGARREWVRLHALDGRLLNAGHPRAGDRTPALMRRLGLAAALSQGVSLSDIEDADSAP